MSKVYCVGYWLIFVVFFFCFILFNVFKNFVIVLWMFVWLVCIGWLDFFV